MNEATNLFILFISYTLTVYLTTLLVFRIVEW